MQVSETNIPGVLVVAPQVYEDNRGHFFETWSAESYERVGIPNCFVQDNQSMSLKGTIRGLHYQTKHPQGKLVRVISGEIFDVAVDVRPNSATFGKWFGELLSSSNRRQLWIPPGLAHGFYVISETAEVTYKCSDIYALERFNSGYLLANSK